MKTNISIFYPHADRSITPQYPLMKAALLDYLANDGLLNSLDLHTRAKRAFLHAFRELILAPRGLNYRVQFTGPTGTNAVEAAIKLARKITGRRSASRSPMPSSFSARWRRAAVIIVFVQPVLASMAWCACPMMAIWAPPSRTRSL